MEPATLAASAVKFIVSQIKKSKGGKNATDEMSQAIWEWLRPIFLRDDEPLNDLKQNPDDELNQKEIELKIQKYLLKHPQESDKLQNIIQKDFGDISSSGNSINLENAKIKSKGSINIVGGNQIK